MEAVSADNINIFVLSCQLVIFSFIYRAWDDIYY